MIFDCPRCEAENAIPVADIPPDGKVAVCQACKQPFRVLPPDPEEMDNFEPEDTMAGDENAEGAVEQTTVGLQSPFAEEGNDEKTAGFFPPSPAMSEPPAANVAVVPPAAPAITKATVVPPLITKNTSELPPDVIGQGPPIGSTRTSGEAALGTEDTLMQAEGARVLGRRQRPRANDDRTPPSGMAAVIAPPSAVTRPMPTPAGAPVPPTPTLPPAANGNAKATAGEGPMGAIKKLPLAVKVAAAVFPVALIVAVLMRPSPPPTDTKPIALPVAPRTSSVAEVAPAPTADPGLAGPTPLSRDVRAEAGYLYVVVEDAIVRSNAAATSPAVGRAREGTLVRVFERVGEASVVMLGETGPAGFVAAASLSPRLTVGALAEEIKFAGCADRSTCAGIADTEGRACNASCATEAPADLGDDGVEALRERCRAACEIARAACAKACTGKGPPPAPKPTAAAVPAPVASPAASAAPKPVATPAPASAAPAPVTTPKPAATPAPAATPKPAVKEALKPKDFKKPRQVY